MCVWVMHSLTVSFTHIVFIALKDVAEVPSFLAVDEGKKFLVLGIESTE